MNNLKTKARSIFYQIQDQDSNTRAEVLDRECAGNADLRALVEALLKADEQPVCFLDQPVVQPLKPADTSMVVQADADRDAMVFHEANSGNTHLLKTKNVQINNTDDRSTGAKRSQLPADTPEIAGYEILEELGRGGMAVVYRARQIKANRYVALKMILPRGQTREEELQRFYTEAEALARLQHPGIVQIFEVGEHRGLPFFSLELCTEGNLHRFLNGTPLAARQAAELLLNISRAVHAAHEAKVIHRDLKPANVLLTHPMSNTVVDVRSYADTSRPLLETLVAKVTDFGLAKKLDEDGQTRSGMIMGTPSYMSPEQATGTEVVGVRADVYSLGAILYECLTGRPPFKAASSAETVLQVVNDEVVTPRQLQASVPRDLETILLKSLDKDPKRRYPTAAALADDLHRFLVGEPIQARRISTPERWLKWTRRHPAAAAVYVLVPVVLLLALLGTGATWLWQQAETAKAKEQASRTLAEQRETQANTERAIANQEREKARVAQKNAEGAKQIADRAKGEALAANAKAKNALYFNRVVRAQLEWEHNRVDQAQQLLEECPEELRDWEWHYVHQLCHSEIFTLKHDATVRRVAYSPVENLLVTAVEGQKKALVLWDPETGQELRRIREGFGLFSDLCFSPDGKWLASAGSNKVKLFHTESGKLVRTLQGRESVRFSPDSKHVATGGADATVLLWNVDTGELLRKFNSGTALARAVVFSPDGKWIVSIYNRAATIWDSTSGEKVRILNGHTEFIRDLCFSPDSTRLVTCSGDQTLKLWDANSGQELRVMRGHLGIVSSVAFGPDGKTIVSGGEDGTVRVWDAQSGINLCTYRGHLRNVLSVAYSRDGKRIASGSTDQTVRIWDTTRAQSYRNFSLDKGLSVGMCFSPDNTHLVCGGYKKVVRWDMVTYQPTFIAPQNGQIWSIAFTPNGDRFACASKLEFTLWDAKTATKLRTLAHKGEVLSVCFSPDGTRFASSGSDKMVKVWDTETGTCLHTMKGHDNRVVQVCFSPDGRTIASAGSYDHTVRIWNAATGELLRTLTPGLIPFSVQYSPDGRRLALGGLKDSFGTVCLLDAQSGQEIYSRDTHLSRVLCVCFSPDGKRLASCSLDRTIRLWDVKSGEQAAVLTGHRYPIHRICFSSDGKRLASCSMRLRAMKIWDAPGYVPNP